MQAILAPRGGENFYRKELKKSKKYGLVNKPEGVVERKNYFCLCICVLVGRGFIERN